MKVSGLYIWCFSVFAIVLLWSDAGRQFLHHHLDVQLEQKIGETAKTAHKESQKETVDFNLLPFDDQKKSALLRGYHVYSDVCAACHSIHQLHYFDLAERHSGFVPHDFTKEFASNYDVCGEIDREGEYFCRHAKHHDAHVKPFENKQQAMANNGGAHPPDFSLITRAREGGAEYIYRLLLGYDESPSDVDLDDPKYYNTVFPGKKIKMASPLYDGVVDYEDGTENSKEQLAKDVTLFLKWASNPHQINHRAYFQLAIAFFAVFSILLFILSRLYWRDIKKSRFFDTYREMFIRFLQRRK